MSLRKFLFLSYFLISLVQFLRTLFLLPWAILNINHLSEITHVTFLISFISVIIGISPLIILKANRLKYLSYSFLMSGICGAMSLVALYFRCHIDDGDIFVCSQSNSILLAITFYIIYFTIGYGVIKFKHW